MEDKEAIERHMCGDPRVFYAIQEAKKNDNSFTEKGLFGTAPTYKQTEVRKIWFQAMSLGMVEGLRMATLDGQKIDLFKNCKEQRHKEFLEKFYKLANEYNCAITFHPLEGMCVIDTKKDTL